MKENLYQKNIDSEKIGKESNKEKFMRLVLDNPTLPVSIINAEGDSICNVGYIGESMISEYALIGDKQKIYFKNGENFCEDCDVRDAILMDELGDYESLVSKTEEEKQVIFDGLEWIKAILVYSDPQGSVSISNNTGLEYNEIKLILPYSINRFCGKAEGELLYLQQVKDRIDWDGLNKIIFPGSVTNVSNSYVQGFLGEIYGRGKDYCVDDHFIFVCKNEGVIKKIDHVVKWVPFDFNFDLEIPKKTGKSSVRSWFSGKYFIAKAWFFKDK